MSNSELPSEVRADIESLLNGTLDAEGVRRLEAVLLDNPAWQQQFLDYCQLHTDLGLSIASDHALEGACQDIGGPIADNSPSRSPWKVMTRLLQKPTPFSMTVATLVMGLLITAMYFMVPPMYRGMTRHKQPDDLSHDIVAQLTGIHDAVWRDGQVGVNLGSHLVLGHRMGLLEGSAEVTYKSGARVTLEAPVSFVVQGRNAAHLSHGKLVARIPASAVGFEVETPTIVVTDLGTEFGVDAESEGETRVSVFVGSVDLSMRKVAANDSQVKLQTLIAGQSVVVEANGQIKSDASDAPQYLREIPQQSKAIQLLAHWRMGEGDTHSTIGELAGEVTVDSQGGRHLTRSGEPTYVATAATDSTMAVEFSGDEDRFASERALLTRTDNWMLEAWVRADSTTGMAVVAFSGDSARNGYGIIRQGRRWRGIYGGVAVMDFGATVERGKWTHLALLRHNGKTRFLVDGFAVGYEFSHSPVAPNGAFMVGGNSLTPDQALIGAIDEIKLSYVSSDFDVEMLHEATP